MTQWHRWFGLLLEDFFPGTAYEVRLEEELSLKRQFLDVLILRRGEGPEPESLPDGLEGLDQYNLVTYKSSAETLDAWALDELFGHYVNYRKQLGDQGAAAPESAFRFYAVSTHHPRKLLQQVTAEPKSAGVFDIFWGAHQVRLVVLRDIPDTPHNVPWQIFSDEASRVQSGLRDYDWHQEEARSLINQFAQHYHFEGDLMAYTLHDFALDFTKEHLHELPPEVLRDTVSPEVLREALPPEERLKGLGPEERLKGLEPEEFLKKLDPKQVEDYLKKLKAGSS